jgi:ectoine hydroxylase-related dioxygenase (phytanoyl-CoA dioxygenase family)
LTPPRVIAIRIALQPEDETNGCMRAVEGSHAWGPIGENKALRAASVTSLLDELPPERRDLVGHARWLALEPGDVSIHHCLTLHGSGANTSERPRKTIILRMFDAACRLDRSRLPAGSEAYFPVDDDGHLVASAFPVVYDAS